MNEAEAAIGAILAATGAADLFDGDPGDANAARRAKRRYRQLVALAHPDVALAHGVDAARAQLATARLGQLHADWQAMTGALGQDPHVVGRRATYPLRRRVRRAPLLATYATDEPG
ncbi:MAG TPA: hypothetical protein PKA93_12280, partial [Arachnia sp.]|nr:hypothetical protein [Arachnia sp.]